MSLIDAATAKWRQFSGERKFHFASDSATSRFSDAHDTACGWRICASDYIESLEPKKKCVKCVRAMAATHAP